MAALVNEGGNLVWQRVQIALLANDASEAAWQMFKQLRMYLATQNKNPKLQFLGFSDSQLTTSNGAQLGTGTPTFYAAYFKKNGSNKNGTTTATYIQIADDATDASTAANLRWRLPALTTNEEKFVVDLSVLTVPKAWSNGVAVVGTTAPTGVGGATTSTAGDTGNGFIIVG